MYCSFKDCHMLAPQIYIHERCAIMPPTHPQKKFQILALKASLQTTLFF